MHASANLPMTAKVAIEMGLDRVGSVKAVAVSLAARFVIEFHRHGFNEPGWLTLQKISRRFRLGDYCTALLAHYPPRFAKAGGGVEFIGLDGRPTVPAHA